MCHLSPTCNHEAETRALLMSNHAKGMHTGLQAPVAGGHHAVLTVVSLPPSELERAQQLAMFTPATDATFITQALHARARALWQGARADLVQHDGFGAQLAFTHGLVASSTCCSLGYK